MKKFVSVTMTLMILLGLAVGSAGALAADRVQIEF